MNGEAGHNVSLAVDIGGTFTDLVAFDNVTGRVVQSKSLTTTQDLSQGIWDCLQKAKIDPREVENIVHGSTVAINIAIEEKGAHTALVVTRGTRDVYKIGRQNRPEAYNFNFKRPRPLVSRANTFEADERITATGETLVALDEEKCAALAEQIRNSGVEAVAVCFLHSYLDLSHENQIGAYLRKNLQGVYVTLSHEIVREYREFERMSTTVMNAYIGPKTSAYVGRIQERLAENDFEGRFLIMQSNGGVMSPDRARSLPVAMMESGPVGGVIAAAEVGARLGFNDVISFDMGGTTAKTSLIKNREVSIAQGYHIGGYASGHAVMFPVVDIVEVGAGGGSIAWIDNVGALKLGPQSAGSNPGPICYQRGGEEPTVTDANVVLGRIGADSLLGGEMKLDRVAAANGIEERLSSALDMTMTEAALGIVKIAVAKMSLTVRGVSVERGYDPREFAMVATGGAGPLHALAIAKELQIPYVIIPNLPAHFSAFGMLMADVRHDYVRTYYKALADSDFSELSDIYDDLLLVGREALRDTGVAEDVCSYQYSMDLRYIGQEFWLQIPVTADEIRRRDVEAIHQRFVATHDSRFGHAAEEEPLELVNLRLAAVGERPKANFPEIAKTTSEAMAGTRPIFFEDPESPVECPVYSRELLSPGMIITGPCVVEEYASTTVLFAGDELEIRPTGEMVIKVRQS